MKKLILVGFLATGVMANEFEVAENIFFGLGYRACECMIERTRKDIRDGVDEETGVALMKMHETDCRMMELNNINKYDMEKLNRYFEVKGSDAVFEASAKGFRACQKKHKLIK